MLLGQVIRNLSDEATAAETLLSLGDLALVARIETVRGAHNETAGAYAANAVARFADAAGDEDWLALMNRLERSDDPAAACLHMMIDWSLKQDAPNQAHSCSCGKSQ